MTRAPLVLGLVAAALWGSGCMPEDLGGGLDITNETGQTIYLRDQPIRSGDTWRYEISDCSDSDLAVRTADGEVVAELTDEWCPGQTWTVTGPGQSNLEDS